MSTIATVGGGNVLVQSQVAPAPVDPGASALQQQFSEFELANAAILAASIGLGVSVDYVA